MVVEEDGLSGIVTFHLVIDTITGFLAPQEVIGNISDIDNFEKFRIVV